MALLPLAASAGTKHKHAASPRLIQVDGPLSLRAHAAEHAFLVGCAVIPEKLDAEQAYTDTIARQASIIVAENAMKWAALRPAPDKFDFHAADDLVVFALSHEQKIRGHNLCWHEALPSWFASTVTRQNAQHILVRHIETVAGRYAGKIHSWDVVNEAIDIKDGRADGLRNSPWLELVGPEYLEIAFRAARRADPHALLAYNDYGIELDTPEQIDKRAQVMMLARRLRARGVPINAVGVQSHLTAGDPMPGAGLQRFVRELHQMGLQVFITEMDVNDANIEGSAAECDAAVAQVYRSYLDMMLAEPNVTAALTWGITDRYTWLTLSKPRADGQPQRPLPFDPDYQPAPAYFAMRDAIDTRSFRAASARQQSVSEEAPRQQGDPYAPFTPNAPQVIQQ